MKNAIFEQLDTRTNNIADNYCSTLFGYGSILSSKIEQVNCILQPFHYQHPSEIKLRIILVEIKTRFFLLSKFLEFCERNLRCSPLKPLKCSNHTTNSRGKSMQVELFWYWSTVDIDVVVNFCLWYLFDDYGHLGADFDSLILCLVFRQLTFGLFDSMKFKSRKL